jgi:transcriptional regulator with XRE-family HTH domain
VSDLSKLRKFTDDAYRVSYLEAHVKGGIAYQIQALREKLGLNQTQFGALIGMPQPVVSRLEDTEYGSVNVNTLLQIANRLGIGLNVSFCSFETVLGTNVSPAAFAVETIKETINRLTAAASLQPTILVVAAPNAPQQPMIRGSSPWQTKQIPNQQSAPQVFQGSGTNSFESFTPMPASHPWGLSM